MPDPTPPHLKPQPDCEGATNEYVLNGTKTFITSGAAEEFYIVMAKSASCMCLRASKEGKQDSTITAFVVERNFEGFAIGQKFDMLGMRGYSTCEIVFNDCKVPKANLLGPPGEGRKVALLA